MNDRERLIELIKIRSYKYSEKPFRLSSGIYSNYYFNLKQTTYSPAGLYLVGKLIFEKIKELGLKVDAIGGLTMGADPIAFAVARYSYDMNEPIEAFVIRKEPKGHGTMSQIEGNVKEGNRVIIIDDVVTTGASTIKAINVAKAAGLIIVGVIALLDRCEQNGRQNIEALGYPFWSILTVRDFGINPEN
ncbi:MAG: orotate phosphoribosyltransferase [Thermodesulfovibrionales bacterium]|nr:orotate phosphoribosyltransferase [Thermodesulfovibrionales bacterium]